MQGSQHQSLHLVLLVRTPIEGTAEHLNGDMSYSLLRNTDPGSLHTRRDCDSCYLRVHQLVPSRLTLNAQRVHQSAGLARTLCSLSFEGIDICLSLLALTDMP